MLWKLGGGRCIYQGEQGTRVYENLLYRWLTLNSDALQTVLNKYSPHRPVLNYIKPLIFMAKQNPGNCCLLGLGGAGAAHALSSYLNHYKITIIEAKNEIIQLATRYFMTNKLSNIEIIHQSAEYYLQHCHLQFQHLIVDLYNANSFPEECNNESFFKGCKQLLTVDGVLAVNLANRLEQKPIFEFIRNQFLNNTLVIPVKNCSNLIIIASNNKNTNSLIDLLKVSGHLTKLIWDPEWGCMASFK